MLLRRDGGSRGPSAPPQTVDGEDESPESCHPVILATGSKTLHEVDFTGPDGFTLERTYRSGASAGSNFGNKWTWTFGYPLSFTPSPDWVERCEWGYGSPGEPCPLRPGRHSRITVHRPDGSKYDYKWDGTRYVDSRPESTSWIVEEFWRDGNGNLDFESSSFTLHREDGGKEVYSPIGRARSVRDHRGVGYAFNYDTLGNLVQSISHSSGRRITLGWSGGRIASVTAPGGKIFHYTYSNGRLTGVTYPDGLGTRTYHYEDARHPDAITGYSVDGVRRTRYSYHADGRVQHSGLEGGLQRDTFAYGSGWSDLTSPAGHTTRYRFAQVNGIPRLVGVTRPASAACAGGAASTSYDSRGYPAEEVDFEGNKTLYSWNNRGQLLTLRTGVAPDGSTTHQQHTTYGWDTARNLLTRESHYGNSGSIQAETLYTWGADNTGRLARRLQRVEQCAPTCASGQKRITTYSYTFHTNGMVESTVVDGPLAGTGDAVTSRYDRQGNLLSVTNGLGHVERWEGHDGRGLPARHIDANGVITRFTWDALGRQLTRTVETPAGARTWATVWRSDGQPASVTDPSGLRHTYVYDSVGRRTEVRKPSPVSRGSNSLDRLLYTWSTAGHVTIERKGYSSDTVGLTITSRTDYEYDTAGYLSRQWGAGGERVYLYDRNGRMAGWSDPLGNGESYGYDSQGRLSAKVDALNGTARFDYDALGRLSRVTDPRGAVTAYTYNGFGELTRLQSPDAGITTHTYDGAGRRSGTTDARGQAFTYTYDALSRPLKVQAGTQAHAFAWDNCTYGVGRLCKVTDPHGELAYTWDAEGWLAAQAQKIGASAIAFGQTYARDAAGRLTGVSYPGGVSVGYGYTNGELRSMTATVGGTTHTVVNAVTTLPFGPASGWTHGNGLVREQSWNPQGLLTALGVRNGSTWLQQLTYTHDGAQRITGLTNHVVPSLTQGYGYDAASRLTEATLAAGNQSFGWDANGNRTRHVWGGVTDTYETAATSNRLLRITGTRATSYTYDGAGNTVTDGTTTYGYSPFNRLNQVSAGGSTTNYWINALGQRVRKDRGTTATTTGFVYGPSGQLEVEYAWGSGAWSHYLRLPDGQPVALVRGGQLYHVHNDHLGRPEAVTSAAKAVVWRAANHAFDRDVTLDAIGGLNLGFPGQYHDAESGLWYNNFRSYNPRTGRYVESDPIGLAGGLNTYSYVSGNPVNLIDPFGLVDRNYTPTWDGAHAGLALIPSPNGMLTVGVHYNGTNFISPSGQSWTPQQLADQIKADTDLSQYSSIGLYSCRTGAEGSDGTTPAQALANALGLPVQAPTQYTWVTNNPLAPYQGNYGKTPTGGVDRTNPGSWVNFYPGRP